MTRRARAAFGAIAALAVAGAAAAQTDPLPSWNDGPAKARIAGFVQAVTEQANGFQTWIVSGGGIEFVRVFSEARYGVPPQQVVGSSVKTKYEVRNGKPAIVRLPQIDFIDDKAGKPVGIHQFIGKRPIAAFGNSDGDFEMLEWTTSAPGARLGLIVRHDDAEREFAYDRTSHVGRLARGLDEGPKRGWTIVSMKNDWRSVYPPEKR